VWWSASEGTPVAHDVDEWYVQWVSSASGGCQQSGVLTSDELYIDTGGE
jgi:hypothetical protein